MNEDQLRELARLVRHYIITSSTAAGSGHPTSSLSATDLMTVLMFGGTFRFLVDNPDHKNNDRLIFSKGHASPLFYALWALTGGVNPKKLLLYRKFGSPLEGHPTMQFPFTEAATGSLGQGLSIGVGMAINAQYLDKLPYRTYVLLGDSEMAEGSQWEAIQSAAHYKLGNLIGILDVNRLGQRGETMYGHDVSAYATRIASFGWKVITINGHALAEIINAYQEATINNNMPTMIIARTVKGKGVSFVENKDGFHGRALSAEDAERALKEIGDVDESLVGVITNPDTTQPTVSSTANIKPSIDYKIGDIYATRKAYGDALQMLAATNPNIVALDAETSNSTHAEDIKETAPERFFEMYIAEQNMAGVALGLSRRGKVPFVSTFAAFFTRAFDQIRMSQYSNANIKFVGSHAGVSIGEDGASQMGLEDIAMFRTLQNATVLYPSDAVSTSKLVTMASKNYGVVYIRTTRATTSVIYKHTEDFSIGGSKILRKSTKDIITVVGAGITLHNALEAYKTLSNEGIRIRVIDCYSIKPLDIKTLHEAAESTKAIITVEDHRPEGGLGEAVLSALANSTTPIYTLAVRKPPMSGKPEELLQYEEIDQNAIVKKVKEISTS